MDRWYYQHGIYKEIDVAVTHHRDDIDKPIAL
jgi:hypothetical protein